MTTEIATKTKTATRLTEADLLAKGHTHIVADTLRMCPTSNKQKVTINTRDAEGAFDGNTREIATSDLHQCYWTQETKDAMDKSKRNAKAKEKRANKPKAVKADEAVVEVGGAAALAAALG